MIELAIWLGCIGTADLAAGLAGQRESRLRDVTGWIVGTLLSFVLATLTGLSMANRFLLSALVAATLALWLPLRVRKDDPSAARALLPLAFFAGSLAVVVGTAAIWPDVDGGSAARWLSDLPFTSLSSLGIDRALLIAAFGVWLTATANVLVRLVLAALGTNVGPAEQKLRGGRVIGPIERLLVYGFGLAGQPTAAALVISAKGLLRFPELSGLRRNAVAEDEDFEEPRPPADGGVGIEKPRVRSIDVVTEYLLVGSMTSWILALAPLVLVSP